MNGRRVVSLIQLLWYGDVGLGLATNPDNVKVLPSACQRVHAELDIVPDDGS